ncbi:MAG: sodium:solute symporter family protein [Pseudomonadota bacterium]|nr:sodium:solute symporter family protein [Pseudomonadota bacterium]
MNLSAIDFAIIGGYFAAVLGVGAWANRRIGSFKDFLVAGRVLTAPILVGTFVATYYGLDVTFGTPETSFAEGISAFFVYAAPFYVFYLILALWAAPRAIATGSSTVPEMMEHYYGPGARLPVAIVTSLYSLPVLSVAGLGVLGHFFLGIDPVIAAIAGGAIAVIYTIMGGLLADAMTDAIQFFIMCITVAIAAAFAISQIGGYSQIMATLDEDFFRPLGSLSLAQILIYSSIALTPLVDPGLFQRIFAARSVADIRLALLLSTGLWIAFDWLVVYFGILGAYLVQSGQITGDPNPTEIVLHIVQMVLPAGLLGLFIAGCLATAMSTIDSYAIIASSAIVYDAMQRFSKKKLSDRVLLLYTRIGIFLAVAFSIFVAFRFDRIRDAWIVMASLLMAALLVPMVAGLAGLGRRSRRAGVWSCWAGLVSAMALIFLFEIWGDYSEGLATRTVEVAALGTTLIREQIGLIALPVSIVAYVAGLLLDGGKK